jgi:predicted nuclease with TOPRIM domain
VSDIDPDIEGVKQALIRDGLQVGRSMHVDAFERIESELGGLQWENKRLREENKRLREELERLREAQA